MIDLTRRLGPLLVAAVLLGSGRPAATPAGLPLVRANDNRIPAGRLSHDTLTVRLVVRMAEWRPEADSGPAINVAAFAEEGRAPSIPGPLIRVPTGTVIVATVRNALADSTLWIHGLLARPARTDDSVALRPGESRALTFAAGPPGTYLYRAMLGTRDPNKDDEREQLAGALIVDPRGGSPPDRIWVINIWGHTVDSTNYVNALAINGRSWPNTERITATVGDTLRWRVVNATWRPHPMHLHGFYYRIDAHGDGLGDSLYATAQRRLVVTEDLRPLETMTMTWGPERPGNWLFHCHIGFHVVPGAATLEESDSTSHDRMSADPTRHMAGLVLGISVRAPYGWRNAPRVGVRRQYLFIDEGRKRGRAARALGFVLQRGDSPPAADSVEISGSPLILTRGQPTDIVVVNRLRETAAIHWHGIELESYSDGVAGWSGLGRLVAPSIQPGDSFVAHLTLPRSGTFMYHTHMNDIEQITSGLYGGLVVLEPGQQFDSSRDHLFVSGWDGPADPPHVLINGDSLPAPLLLTAGVPHRFRFVNIGPAGGIRPTILRDSVVVSWRALAKDGAELPTAQATVRPSGQRVQVGETFDFEWIPEPGEYRMVIGDPGKPDWQRRIIVR